MKTLSYYIESYTGIVVGLFVGIYLYTQNIFFWGIDNVLISQSIDICFILFGFLLTILALIVQGDNQTLQRLRKHIGYNRIILFNRRIVILSIILGFFSTLVLAFIDTPTFSYINQIAFSVFIFLWIWLLWDTSVFLKVFYNIIISAK